MTDNAPIPSPNIFPSKKPAPPKYRNQQKKVLESAQKLKSTAPRKIRSCHHVPLGAVWCQECANVNLAYWRNMVEKAKNSNFYVREEVKRKITEALEEYSLTEEGLRALERVYVRTAADDPSKSLEAHTAWMSRVKKASLRNTEARRNSKALKTLDTVHQYGLPPKNSLGKFDSREVYEVFCTRHAQHRMELRNISKKDINEAFKNAEMLEPQGHGKWILTGKNGIVVCGYFEVRDNESCFVTTTTYHLGTEDIS